MFSSVTTSNPGVISRLRARLFGQRDAIEDQLKDIAKQGSSWAKLAHLCALLLIVLFSLGSLVALSGDALAGILSQWQSTQSINIPASISVGVSTLLVLAMDVRMVYAASMLRLLASRQADRSERRLHQAVMFTVAALEASTYGYMSWLYEHPHNPVAWALILARASAAPLLSIYLSMARPLPVTSRDILYQVELASGKGVIRDAVTVANDANAPLADKMALYGASALMSPQDRTRLDTMLAVVTRQRGPVRIVESDALPVQAAQLQLASDPPVRPARQAHSVAEEREGDAATAVAQPAVKVKKPTETPEQRCRRLLKRNPTLSKKELARLASCSESTAGKWKRAVLAEGGDEQL